MPYTGYPTPDLPVGEQTFRCIQVTVPDSIGDVFVSVLLGQYAEMKKEWYWVQTGTMSPEEAADLAAQGLALTDADGENCMSCETMIDCIENNPDVGQALYEYLVNNGYGTGSSEAQATPVSPAISGMNLLPSGYTCDDDHLFGMARFIVQNLHDGTLQLLQQLELATNQAELLGVMVDNVEVASYIGSVLEFVTWIQDQFIEYYDAAWSTTVDDTLSCMVYCTIKGDCEVTIDKLITAYGQAVTESFSLPLALDVVDDLWDWIDGLDYETAAAVAVVGSFHWSVLQMLRFGSSAIAYTSGIRTFQQIIALAANDTDSDWNVLCDDCPTPYPLIVIGAPCSGGVFGTVEQLSVDTWRVRGTLNGSVYAAVFSDAFNRAVTVVSTTATVNVTDTQVQTNIPPSCTVVLNGGGISSLNGSTGTTFIIGRGATNFDVTVTFAPE